jgi:hypothetical protein
MLTERANKYLSSLKRGPAQPAKLVEQSLFEQGAPCFDSWLFFQERYAGFMEPLGSGDFAVWGIVHEAPRWLDPLRAQIDREVHQPVWYVTCADVHPSYVYRLDQAGAFFTPPAASFDVKVEQNALIWAFFQSGRAQRAQQKELRDPEFLTSLRQELASKQSLQLVVEASDDNTRFYASTTQLVREDARLGSIREAWRRA